MEANQPIETIHLSDYLKIITKRKTLVCVFLLVTVSLTMLFSFLMKPVYEAASVMVIDKEQTASPITGEKIDFGSYQSELLTFNTHFKLITSKPVITAVIRELKLDSGEGELEISPLKSMIKRLKSNIKLLFKSAEKELTPEEKLAELITTIQESIDIKTTRETRLLTITVKNTDPQLAEAIANALAKKYIEFDVSNKLEASKENLAWMHNELYTLKKKLEDDEEKFLEYKKLHNVFSVEGKQKVIDQKISEFNNEYLAARNKRLELDEKLKEIDKQFSVSADLIHIRSIIGNPAIDSIYGTLTTLEVEASKLSKVYKAKHPKMEQVNSEIAKIRTKLQTELQKEVNNLRSERTVLFAREQVMEKNISEFEGDALDAGSKELRYTILQRNVTTSQNLYDTLLTKVKESNVLSSGSTSNIRVVENATLPADPVKPNKKKNLLLSLILGLFGGVGLAFFLEYLDQTVRTEEDVTTILGVPVLAVIPVADTSDRQGAY